MEGVIKNVQVYDKNCIGSKKFNRDIMVSFMMEGGDDIHDVFFTTEQAQILIDRVAKRLEENKS